MILKPFRLIKFYRRYQTIRAISRQNRQLEIDNSVSCIVRLVNVNLLVALECIRAKCDWISILILSGILLVYCTIFAQTNKAFPTLKR